MLLRSKTWPAPPLKARREPGKGLAGQWPDPMLAPCCELQASASKYHGGNEIPGGLSPMTFHPKECGKHLWPPHKPLKWTGLALQ